MKLRAYAKINLGLHVVNRRPDGYHNIETVFHLIDLFDEIDIVQVYEGIHFASDCPELSSDNSNLCVRAANLLRDLTGIHTGVEISLTKRIPIGAGLGGGSSDAAAVLRGLTKIWSLDITRDELQTVSATLGSDVPFFFSDKTAFATGRGEALQPFDLRVPYAILVVTPPIPVSTGWAYSNLHIATGVKRPNIRKILEEKMSDPAALQRGIVNDFEEVVFAHHPEVARIKSSLLKEGAVFSLMSGSGSSVFGFFHDPAAATEASRRLSEKYFTSVTNPSFKPDIN